MIATGRIARCLLAISLSVASATGSAQTNSTRDSAEGRGVAVDLAAEFAAAQLRTATRHIEFASPGIARQLSKGWSRAESSSDRSWVWSDGPTSHLSLFFEDSRERTLILRCRPFRYPEAPPQVMTVELNDQRIATLKLASSVDEYRVTLPAGVVRDGDNDLRFHYSNTRVPAEVVEGSQDRRALAVAWEWLQVEGAAEATLPEVRAVDGQRVLVLHPGVRVDYYLELPRDAVFVADSLSRFESNPDPSSLEAALADAQPDPVLRVAIDEDSPRDRSVSELRASSSVTRLELGSGLEPGSTPTDAPRIVRLSLSAVGGTGALVSSPAIHGTQASPTPESAGHVPSPRADAHDPSEARDHLAASTETGARPPNVILYVVDTLRASSLGVYGSDRGTSPRIDAFARDATMFRVARANTAWTRPGVASILTGLTPWRHRANGTRDRLAERIDTLAEALRGAGYDTAGFVTNGNVSKDFGFAQGFDTFEVMGEDLERHGVHRSAGDLHERVVAWLAERRSDRPLFLYLHATDPHAPYAPASPYLERFAPDSGDPALQTLEYVVGLATSEPESAAATARRLEALYDAEIAYFDAEFGRMMDTLSTRFSLLDDALVAFTADHGEEFHEHGSWQHGKTLYEEQLRIPLVIRFPAAARMTVEPSAAQQIDVYPTILSAVGVTGASVEGVDLRSQVSNERLAVALLEREGRHLESVVYRNFKLISDPGGRGGFDRGAASVLFDLEKDPGEQDDLADRRPVLAGYLERLLRDRSRQRDVGDAPAPEVPISREVEETLKALGYVE